MSTDLQNFGNQPFSSGFGWDDRTGGTAISQPRVFNYSSLWQHKMPLLDMLRSRYGHRQLDSLGGSYGWSVRYRQTEDYEALGIFTLAEYIDAFRAQQIRLPYLRHLSLNRAMPLLRQFIREPAEFRPNWVRHRALDRLGGPELFIGQAGTVFGHLHQDQVSVHVGFVQLQGEKEFVLLPPSDAPYLYTIPGREYPFQLRNSQVRYADLENLERFPLLKSASPRRLVLREGQALLLPADWWHTTRNLSDSVSYSVRIINGSNASQCLLRHIEGIPRWLRRSFAGKRP